MIDVCAKMPATITLIQKAILFFGLMTINRDAYSTVTAQNQQQQQPPPELAGLNESAILLSFPNIADSPSTLDMIMDNSSLVNFTLDFDKTIIQDNTADIFLSIVPKTSSPQFDILLLSLTNSTQPQIHRIDKNTLENNTNSYRYNGKVELKASYIGLAVVDFSVTLLNKQDNTNKTLVIKKPSKLDVRVTRPQGLIDTVFVLTVIVFITISYVNLGAQIDAKNVRRLIETPSIVFFGYLIGCLVMPLASWFAGRIFFPEQAIFRIGSFIHACCPAASASVFWAVMFDADKELALGLQIASTIGALFTMPIFLYTMDKSLQLEGNYSIKVPYKDLGRTLVVLLIALFVGSYLSSTSVRAKKISQKIYRPLVKFVLSFIVIFSTIVYWYIFKMFDLNIWLMSLSVTSATYVVSGLLGYMISRDIDRMITITISSTYRNSGIAFAALVVAFREPETFIAYIPCLGQVLTICIVGLIFYLIKLLRNFKVKEDSK